MITDTNINQQKKKEKERTKKKEKKSWRRRMHAALFAENLFPMNTTTE